MGLRPTFVTPPIRYLGILRPRAIVQGARRHLSLAQSALLAHRGVTTLRVDGSSIRDEPAVWPGGDTAPPDVYGRFHRNVHHN
eukprot:1917637-Amphidinium_carterae.1